MASVADRPSSPARWLKTMLPLASGRLFRKYAALLIALIGSVLAGNAAIEAYYTYRESRDALIAVQQEKAKGAAAVIEQFVREIEGQLGWTTHASIAAGASGIEQRRFDFLRLLRQAPAITELTYLDATGKEQLRVSRLAMDIVGSTAELAQDPRFIEAKANRRHLSPVYFRKESEPYMTLSVAGQGRNAGVTVAEVNLKFILEDISRIKIGRAGAAYVIDRNGLLIAHPDIGLVLRKTDLSQLDYVVSARRHQIAPGEKRLRHDGTDWMGRSVLTASAPIGSLSWLVFVDLPLSEAFEPILHALLRSAIVVLGALALAALAGLWLAQRIAVPIGALAEGAQRIGSGELDHRIDIKTGDEIEQLANSFNAMGGQLKAYYAGLERTVAERTAELKESLDHQTATAEVLGAISRSPREVQPVLDTIVETAARLCHAEHATIFHIENCSCHLRASNRTDPEFTAYLAQNPIVVDARSVTGRAALEGRTQHVPDTSLDTSYDAEVLRRANTRTLLSIPLLREGAPIGVITMGRTLARPFADKEIALVQTFADQAVIAIENARLFEAEQTRTKELQESLEYQTATANVLDVISRSPTDIQPVLDNIAETSQGLCQAERVSVWRLRNGAFELAAARDHDPAGVEFLRSHPIAPGNGSLAGRCVLAKRALHVVDVHNDPDNPANEQARVTNSRTMLCVPLMREGEAIGALTLARRVVQPFTQRQIELVTAFANQAVIAINNVGLFEEVQARTHELQESLEYQLATSEVLGVIARSPGNLQPVLDAIVEAAGRLCGAEKTGIRRRSGEGYPIVAAAGFTPEQMEYLRANPVAAGPGTVVGRAAETRRPVYVPDVETEPGFTQQALAQSSGFRAVLAVPLLREGELIGVLTLTHSKPDPFSHEQIERAETFADQAVIAIENARLFEAEQTRTRELQESLEFQTATSEVLAAISRAPNDLQTVFDTIVTTAGRLCDNDITFLFRLDRGDFRLAAIDHPDAELAKILAENPLPLDRKTLVGRAGLERKTIHVTDRAADPEYSFPQWQERTNYRSQLTVPLLRDGQAIGVIALCRTEVKPFTDKQIVLIETFARQAVIAIENTRLFEALEKSNQELSVSLEQQTATSELLKVIGRSSFDLQPVFETLAENAVKLSESDRAFILRYDGELLRLVASHNVLPDMRAFIEQHPIAPGRESGAGRAIVERRTVHIRDVRADPEYTYYEDLQVPLRTVLAIPMLRGEEVLGVIAINRHEVRSFSESEIALMESFADQASIAIENTRLFEAEQTRTKELTESLEYQTAIAQVLGVISRSPNALTPVLDAIVETAGRLCAAKYAMYYEKRGDLYHATASNQAPEQYMAHAIANPLPADRHSLVGRTASEAGVVHIADCLADPDYTRLDYQRIGQHRTMLGIPLLRDGVVIGVIALLRAVVEPFTQRQIDLVRTFADQAVIAINNVGLFEEVQARTKELTESLEYQTATSDVLGVISRSPSELQPVLDALIASASKLCEAPMVALYVRLGDERPDKGVELTGRARHGFTPGMLEALAKLPQSFGRGSLAGRVLASLDTVHIPDAANDPEYTYRDYLEITGTRTLLGVPLKRAGEPIGMLALYRTEARPFTARQIELMETFADQAVIAIENARLFEAEQTRTRELGESLEYQTAISNVLGAIASSATDTKPVFDAIVDNAARLCGAEFSSMTHYDGELVHLAALNNMNAEVLAEFRARYPLKPDKTQIGGRAILSGQIVRVIDILEDPDYPPEMARAGGWRSMMGVPLLSKGKTIGAVVVAKREVAPYTQRQVQLVQTFADQAVIAIENARLFEAEQTRTRELTESLEYQTAISDVLEVISTSPNSLQPVFETIVATATKLCHGDRTILRLREGDVYPVSATYGLSEQQRVNLLRYPLTADRGSIFGRAAIDRQTVHLADTLADPEFGRPDAPVALGIRSGVAVPLMRDGNVFGVVTVTREVAKAFEPRQVQLLETFARQAVIAIDNARLFEAEQARTRELTESLEYQTATSDVLGVISRSKFDLQPVLDSIVETAARLCQADKALIRQRDGSTYRIVAALGHSPEQMDYLSRHTVTVDRSTMVGRVVLDRATVHVPDVLADTDFTRSDFIKVMEFRTGLAVPLMREGELLGVLVLLRNEQRPFETRQIDLVKTFADQAVIAINNVGLFEEVQARTKELTESLEYQTATSEVLGVISRSPTQIQPVLDTLVLSATRLCEAQDAIILIRDGDVLVPQAHHGPAETRIGERVTISRGWVTGRSVLEGRSLHVADILAAEDEYPVGREFGLRFGHRATLASPLMRRGTAIGAILLRRIEPRPFTDRQIALLQTFADQAVIAINNVGLFEEVQARTKELTESLRQQTATADVLKTISRSAFDLQTVLDTLVASAAGLCASDLVAVHLFKGGGLRGVARFGFAPELARFLDEAQQSPGRGALGPRTVIEGKAVHIADARADDEYTFTEFLDRSGARSMLGVPLLRDGKPVGVVVQYRTRLEPYTPKQIELAETFADQAVIAIENVRLFDETQEALARQTASADILRVISTSPTDVTPVFNAIVRAAVRLLACDMAIVQKSDGKTYSPVAGATPAGPMADFKLSGVPVDPDHNFPSRAIVSKSMVHLPDWSVIELPPHERHRRETLGVNSALYLPLLRGDECLGVLLFACHRAREFSGKEITLAESFRDQAMIAIENTRLFEAEQTRTKELTESLEYQTATSGVLSVINSSVGKVEPVFEVILESARELLEAEYGHLLMVDGDMWTAAALQNVPQAYADFWRAGPVYGGPETLIGRIAATGRPFQRADARTGDGYLARGALAVATVELGGARTLMGVPLLKDGRVLGAIVLYRMEVRPFEDKQIALLSSFADQAVIAIENARLFEAEQTRTKELGEALEYQTATSEVLGVISKSPSSVAPVFETIITMAEQLCHADFGFVYRRGEDGRYHFVSAPRAPQEYVRHRREHPVSAGDESIMGRSLQERRAVHVADVKSDDVQAEIEPHRLGKIRSALAVPLMSGGEPVGVIGVVRSTPNPFSDRQIALVETFADQAVIAIENARLLDELQTRQKELAQALEFETATSEVLGVISAKPGDLEPVYQTMLASALRHCEAGFGGLFRYENGTFRAVAGIGVPDGLSIAVKGTTVATAQARDLACLVADCRPIHTADLRESDAYKARDPFIVGAVDRGGARSGLLVPLVKEGQLIGAFAIYRKEVRAFTDKQIALVTSFARQAVIAMENARLLDELQSRQKELARSVEELRSLGEVGRTVSSTLDMNVVLETVLENACRITYTSGGTIYVYDKAKDEFHLAAGHNMSEEHIARVRSQPIRMGEAVVGEAAERREAVQIEDMQKAPATPLLDLLLRAGVRAVLAVPLLHQNDVIGALVVRRGYAGAFSPETVRLLEAFAAQSAIAVNNARLFKEVEEKGRQLAVASQHKSQFLANMSHELRTPLNAILGYTELMQDGIYGALPTKSSEVLNRVQTNGRHLLGLINSVLDLSKIEAGQLVLDNSEYAIDGIVQAVMVATESLATEKKIALKMDLAKDLPRGIGDERRLTQVLLNLVGNAIKFTDQGEVRISAAVKGRKFVVGVTDTGPGIPPAEQDRIFEEFHQVDSSNTKVKGGTGLGLAIAKRIVEMHGGRIWVESQLGQGSTFRFEVPVRAERQEHAA
jgi:GAF domain-containing protein/two-component sensor histidine kinase